MSAAARPEGELGAWRDRLQAILAAARASGYARPQSTRDLRAHGLRFAPLARRTDLARAQIETVSECLRLYVSCEPDMRSRIAASLRQWCATGVLDAPDLDAVQAADELHAIMSAPDAPSLVPASASRRDEVQCLRGVGAKMAARLASLGIRTLQDLLMHFPQRYAQFENLSLKEAAEERTISVMGRICEGSLFAFRFGQRVGKAAVKARIRDGTDEIDVIWWNRWVLSSLKEKGLYHFYGKVERYNGRRMLNNPQFAPVSVQTVKRNLELAAQKRRPRHVIMALYPLGEGVSHAFLRKMNAALLDAELHHQLEDDLPPNVRRAFNLLAIEDAVAALHRPAAEEDWRAGRRRMIFQSLYQFHTGLARAQQERRARRAPALPAPADFTARYDAALPFALTSDQRRALAEILQDIARDAPTFRLLRGEAGSGKTVVMAAAMLAAAQRGYQAALIAPTQILARQHLASLQTIVQAAQAQGLQDGVRLDLLTGALPEAEKTDALRRIAAGCTAMAVGTTALIQPQVRFRRLGLLIIDEEHRFSVNQREVLARPWTWPDATQATLPLCPHVLSLSATPIPRSLNQVLTGYLDVSEIRTLPAHRQPVRTFLREPADRMDTFKVLGRQIQAGRQAFIVYPQIDMQDADMTIGAVETEYEWLAQDVFPDLRLAKAHGRMAKADVDAVMQRFKDGAIDVLVATTVIEVGIDVPNATFMIIENAERFGLAQLHQLRNRVGRGPAPGTCVLMCSQLHEATKVRLGTLMESDSGFDIAERDLELRGPGELLGQRQSGVPDIPYMAYLDAEVAAMIEACFQEPA